MNVVDDSPEPRATVKGQATSLLSDSENSRRKCDIDLTVDVCLVDSSLASSRPLSVTTRSPSSATSSSSSRRLLWLTRLAPSVSQRNVLEELGIVIKVVGIPQANDDEDLLDEYYWGVILGMMASDNFDVVFMNPSCTTFTDQFRGQGGADRYGWRNLRDADKERVREETLHWFRVAAAFSRCSSTRTCFVVIVPNTKISPLILDELSMLAVEGREWECEGGEKCWGRVLSSCTGSLGRVASCEEDLVLRALLAAVTQGGLRDDSGEQRPAAGFVRVGRWGNSLVRAESFVDGLCSSRWRGTMSSEFDDKGRLKVRRIHSLRGTPHGDAEDFTVGGLRSTRASLDKVPGHKVVGTVVAKVIDSAVQRIDHMQRSMGRTTLTEQVIGAIGNEDMVIDEALVDDVRLKVAQVLKCDDVTAIDTGTYSTCLRGHLLHSWAVAAGDPAANVARWTWEGTPAGLDADFDVLMPVFPPRQTDEVVEELPLDCVVGEHVNYKGVDEDPDVDDIIQNYVDLNYVARLNTYDECVLFVKGKPVLSKIGCITKVSRGKIKKRIIVDAKQSKVSKAARLKFRSILPRVLDVVFDALELLSDLPEDEDLEAFVLDFVDAFWHLPLRDVERRYFVTKFKGKYLVWLRTAQGSRGAPLSWAALAGLVMRCAVAVAGETVEHRRLRARAPGQCYVDDPLLVVRGTAAQRQSVVMRVVLTWLVFGFPLAFRKAQLAQLVVWIGFQIQIFRDKVVVTIPAEKVEDMRKLTNEILLLNVVGVRALRSYVGKAVNMASILHVWRPFLDEIWAALRGRGGGQGLEHMGTRNAAESAPTGCVWTSQVRPALLWIKAFLEGRQGTIQRVFTLQSYLRMGVQVDIVTDASPWGFGGWIAIDGNIVEYFAEAITNEDLVKFNLKLGEHLGQQTWEALAVLIALRQWRMHWMTVRAKLLIKADNMSALALVAYFKAKGGGPGKIARDVALEFADAEFGPDCVAHLPGVANKIADTLSRFFQPGHDVRLPAGLGHALRVHPPARPASWYLASSPPPAFTADGKVD